MSGGKEMEESNERALELGAAAGVDGGWWESFPHDRLADVGGNEERNTRPETVALQKSTYNFNNLGAWEG